jgi:hypothetical protein
VYQWRLPQKIRDSLLKGVGKRTTPLNVFALLFAAEHAMTKLNPVIDAWADVVRACYGGTHCQRGVDG